MLLLQISLVLDKKKWCASLFFALKLKAPAIFFFFVTQIFL